ncbi:glutathione S-transferase [Caulobacter ginsengisoli]|uniref:Glutathione S-transferase n=1 Tax=Caulobacter ginsengisoli TaxID=400775 RepID=A0ABU0IX35_9CAUL|nr:glutathione S-transferase family protein [Caulobacter ginsengisoli]MDQ0466572.1 glutathione S-transferase [Caulobacter ginsengisoli]
MLTIHNFPRGGRGQRVAWLCEEMGLEYRMAAVTYPPSPQYLALNPMGTVPFLEDDATGAAIGESAAICLYIAQAHGPTPLLPAPGHPDLAKVLEWTVFSEATLGSGVNTLLAERFGAPEADKGNWSARMAGGRVDQAVELIASRLGERDYLVGDSLTLADICIASILGVWRGALDRTAPPNLAAWLDRLAQRPAYQRARAAVTG